MRALLFWGLVAAGTWFALDQLSVVYGEVMRVPRELGWWLAHI